MAGMRLANWVLTPEEREEQTAKDMIRLLDSMSPEAREIALKLR
jgi:hypothetical protein